MSDEELERLAAQAWIYGYPLVENLTQVLRFTTDGLSMNPAAAFNAFSHATRLAGPDDKFVTLNNDTVYSMAQLDLSAGPQMFEVPDAGERYCVFQFVDAWTNNFAYVGTRATGGRAGRYLITGPGWKGEIPDGMARIASPTMIASIVGRWGCDGPADLPAIAQLQSGLRLSALNKNATLTGVPDVAPALSGAPAFFARLATWSQAFPPSDPDVEYQQRLAALGVGLGEPPVIGERALAAGVKRAQAQLEALTHSGVHPPVNGWLTGLHLFDYNLDFFELGALDDPAWKIADRAKARVERALATRTGLWGNHGYEAAYYGGPMDDRGELLTGKRRYEMRLPEPPPAEAFWSITMYDTPAYYLVANPIDRYSIGDRTPGLRRDPDGSLTIYIQRDDPGADRPPIGSRLPPAGFAPRSAPMSLARASSTRAGSSRRSLASTSHGPCANSRVGNVRLIFQLARALIASPISFAPMMRQMTAMIVAFSRASQPCRSARILVARSPIR